MEFERCLKSGIALWLPEFPGYPPLLASIQDAPRVLYVKGALASLRTLAIVGSRRPTPYGLRMARHLSREAARAAVVTVSGLARGIDTEVHRSTLDAGGATWAVLGSGLHRPYPRENAGLMDEIVARGGAVLSEAPLDAPPSPENFPRRNRIISALSWGTVVVEGDVKSGALITARCALEQGREVFALPGPADSRMSEGPNGLIRDGARLLTSLQDIVDELPAVSSDGVPVERTSGPASDILPRTGEEGFEGASHLSIEEQKVLKLIGSEEVALEHLIQGTGWNVERLAGILMDMEIKGLVCSCAGQRYARA